MTYAGPERRFADRDKPTLLADATSGRAIIQSVAESYGYSAEALTGRSQDRELVKVRGKAALEARRRLPGKSLTELGILFGNRTKQNMDVILRSAEAREKIVNSYFGREDYILEVEAQNRRLCGVDLTLQVAHHLSVPTWQAIFLAVLMEAYPIVKSADQICEAYDVASEKMDRSATDGVTDESMKTFVKKIRARFEELGLPDPVARVRPRALVLTDSAARWLHVQFGRPIAVRVAA